MSGKTPSDCELVGEWQRGEQDNAEAEQQAYIESIEKLDLQDTKVGQRLLFDLASPAEAHYFVKRRKQSCSNLVRSKIGSVCYQWPIRCKAP